MVDWRNRIVGEGDEKPDELLANPANWRIHPKHQQEALAGVLDQVGWVQRVLVNRQTGNLIDGHLRVTLALRRGEAMIPVEYVDLSEDEERLILATLDPLAGLAQADDAKLAELLRGVQADDAAVVAMLAQLAEDNGLFGKEPKADPGPQIDKADELRVKWGTALGQVWELGAHRLACGDCTDRAVVDAVMGGENADLCFTSPPYWTGQPYDDKPGLESIKIFMGRAVAAIADVVSRRIVIETGNTSTTLLGEKPYRDILLDSLWVDALLVHGWLLRYRRVWAKHGPLLRNGPESDLIDDSCEMILTFYRHGHNEGGQERISEPWAQSGYWDDMPPITGGKDHPCPFPVELAERYARLYTKLDQIVLDPFVGSGTTLIACERLGRKCRAIEIDPGYCAVTIDRWQQMTDGEPRLVSEV